MIKGKCWRSVLYNKPKIYSSSSVLHARRLWLKQTVDKIKTVKYYFCAGNISVLRSSCAGNEGRTFEINSLIVSRIRGFYRIFLRIRGEFVPKLYNTVSISAKGGGAANRAGSLAVWNYEETLGLTALVSRLPTISRTVLLTSVYYNKFYI